jgi:hypothetical protein
MILRKDSFGLRNLFAWNRHQSLKRKPLLLQLAPCDFWEVVQRIHIPRVAAWGAVESNNKNFSIPTDIALKRETRSESDSPIRAFFHEVRDFHYFWLCQGAFRYLKQRAMNFCRHIKMLLQQLKNSNSLNFRGNRSKSIGRQGGFVSLGFPKHRRFRRLPLVSYDRHYA